MSDKDKYLIIGSGISGLISALILCEKGLGKDTLIIEKNEEIGGLLRKFDYGSNGVFDYGMHNFLETGIKELDKIIFNLLPEEDWELLQGEKRDLAGIYFNNRLQSNSPYFDLRNLKENQYYEALGEFFKHLNNSDNSKNVNFLDCNAEEYSKNRYGEFLAKKTVIPCVEKIYRKKAVELDYMATLFTPMNRVVIADYPLVEELTHSKILRDIFAWSDQRTLPLERSSGRRAYYPKNYGAYRIVEAILKKLKENGVEILTNYQVCDLKVKSNKINEVLIIKDENLLSFKEPKLFLWSSSILLLGNKLNFDVRGFKSDKALKTVIINILIDKPLNMNGLYYFFCYDPGFYTYRLTDYIQYSPGAKRNNQYPICLEFLLTEDELKTIDINEKAIEELNKFNILSPSTTISFVKYEILENGFPMPSVNNIKIIREIRNQIKKRDIKNLLIAGILSEDNMFFQTDVIIDVYNKLKNQN